MLEEWKSYAFFFFLIVVCKSLLVRLFSMPVVIPLFRDPFWVVTILLASYHGCYSFLYFLVDFNCWCEENTGRHFKGFYFIKNI